MAQQKLLRQLVQVVIRLSFHPFHAGLLHQRFDLRLLKPQLQPDAGGFAHPGVVEYGLGVVALVFQPLRQLRRVYLLADAVRVAFPVAIRRKQLRPLIQKGPRLLADPDPAERVLNCSRISAVKHRRDSPESHPARRPTQMRFQHLANVHTAGHADGVKDDIYRGPVLQVRHVLYRQDPGDHALVAVAPRHLVTFRHLPSLGDRDTHHRLHTGRQFICDLGVMRPPAEVVRRTVLWTAGIVVRPREKARLDHLPALTVRHPQRGVFYLPRLLPEDCSQELLLSRQLRLALRRDLADEDVAGLHLGAHAHNPVFVKVNEAFLAHIRDITCYLLRAQLRVARLHLVLLDVDRRELIVLSYGLGDDNRVLKVVAFPAHERAEQCLP